MLLDQCKNLLCHVFRSVALATIGAMCLTTGIANYVDAMNVDIPDAAPQAELSIKGVQGNVGMHKILRLVEVIQASIQDDKSRKERFGDVAKASALTDISCTVPTLVISSSEAPEIRLTLKA